jgi:hypothetical protein
LSEDKAIRDPDIIPVRVERAIAMLDMSMVVMRLMRLRNVGLRKVGR